jgi:hypothetical protein
LLLTRVTLSDCLLESVHQFDELDETGSKWHIKRRVLVQNDDCIARRLARNENDDRPITSGFLEIREQRWKHETREALKLPDLLHSVIPVIHQTSVPHSFCFYLDCRGSFRKFRRRLIKKGTKLTEILH